MKLFGFGKKKGESPESDPKPLICKHPISYQVALHQDLSAPSKVTNMKCTQCGMIIPAERSKAA